MGYKARAPVAEADKRKATACVQAMLRETFIGGKLDSMTVAEAVQRSRDAQVQV